MENEKPSSSSRAFPCPYEGCLQAFASAGQLVNHKKFTPDHEYCERCDEDFKFEEDLLLHKMKSSRHIICPICFDDFRSEGGRDMHIQQFHREEQNIECIGCKAKFLRAAPLMAHVEQGQCEKISLDKYRMRRVEKKAVKDKMNEHLTVQHSFLLSSAASSVDGGVGVTIESVLEESPDKTAEIEAKKASITEKMSAMELGGDRFDSFAPVPESVRSIKQWPTLREGDGEDEESDHGGPSSRSNFKDDDLMAFSEASYARSRGGHERPTIETVIPRPGPLSASASDSGSGWDTSRVIPARTLTEHEASRKITLSESELSKFFSDVHGTYICPCDTSFKTKGALQQHIASGVHAAGVARCPVCLRMFKSSAALVAHCESATKRCRINQTRNFGQVIDEISGGIIGAAGRNDDGTVRFEAAPGAKEIEW
ncbi:hypothetical protein MGYG_07793 [Nannizzia gypsea CBS 118893]|uniref:C2H2-type domain-containing protein n=1 Tax=Arthroderma gypseum (strain ATCC MYA-4604 / CBS 118893) TaxID=535722 RepID=E4V462_ARTGP|nr:hypothetical protein MGYG_07793 [Nannizzia gypsea CBS 118893]EFR04786.1 hypothetical protein MGYG_07793 [Nannizzia gypsea CBS 118893]